MLPSLFWCQGGYLLVPLQCNLARSPRFKQPNNNAWTELGSAWASTVAWYCSRENSEAADGPEPSGTTSIPSLNSVTSIPVVFVRRNLCKIHYWGLPCSMSTPCLFASAMNLLRKYAALFSRLASFTSWSRFSVISTSPSPVPTLKNRLQPTGAHHKLSAGMPVQKPFSDHSRVRAYLMNLLLPWSKAVRFERMNSAVRGSWVDWLDLRFRLSLSVSIKYGAWMPVSISNYTNSKPQISDKQVELTSLTEIKPSI